MNDVQGAVGSSPILPHAGQDPPDPLSLSLKGRGGGWPGLVLGIGLVSLHWYQPALARVKFLSTFFSYKSEL